MVIWILYINIFFLPNVESLPSFINQLIIKIECMYIFSLIEEKTLNYFCTASVRRLISNPLYSVLHE